MVFKVELVDPFTNVTTTKRTCAGALGYGFAAGTTDGPGLFSFQQGELTGNKFWDAIRDFLQKPSDNIVECHAYVIFFVICNSQLFILVHLKKPLSHLMEFNQQNSFL